MAAVFASLAAVSGADDIGSIAWRKLGAAEGFAGGSVAALLQDRRGYVWIGASGGLYRFDGLNFVRIGPPGGVFASISCLAEDGQGFIWAGSMGMGLGVYDPQKDVFQRIGAESAERSRGGGVVSLAIGKDGRALALWADGSLSVLSGETDAQGRALFSVADAGLSLDAGYGSGPLAVDISGKIWVGSESRGLRVFGPGGQLLGDYAHDPAKADSLGSSSIRILFEDSLGYLWVGLGDGGVDLYREGKFIHALAASPGGRGDIWCRYSGRGTVVSIAEDLKGRIWIGKEGGGLAVLEPSTMKISQEDGFSGRRVLAMMRDRRGLMWLGLERGGLLTGDHRSASVRRYAASADGQTLAAALGMGKSENGRPIVISRSGRIFGYDPYDDEFRVLSSPGAWVPLSSGGIARLPSALAGRFRGSASQGSAPVSSVLEDGSTGIWIGTEGDGLFRYDRMTGSLSAYPSLAAKEISALALDGSGRLWVGSRDSGLFALEPGGSSFRRAGIETRHGSGLGTSRIENLLADSRGRIWVGTGGAGLCSVDPRTGSVDFRGKDAGIYSDSVYGMVEDRAGRLWVLGTAGLYCLDLERSEAFLMGKEDGLPGSGFDSGAVLSDADGMIWVFGDEGVGAFDPDRIARYASLPDVLISDLVPLGEKRILSRSPDGTSIVLPHDNAGLGFSIAVMDFSSSSRNRYALKLEGMQSAWTEMGNVNKGYLAPLAPGTYMLRVKAANGNGIWNSYGASLSISVKPPWWRTWWFESLAYGGLAAGLSIALIMGVRSLKKRNALLVKFARHIEEAREEERKLAARDVHDEIGQYLMALNFGAYWLSSHLDAAPEERLQKIGEMRSVIQGAMDSVKKIAQRLRPLSFEGNDFPDAIRFYIRNFATMSGIESEVTIGEGWKEMPAQYARIFFRILQEMVSNVARHSGARRMEVEFLSEEQWYILSVRDDGKGMDQAEIEAHDSFGLIGMREGCASEGGELEIRTSRGKGCALYARLPRTPRRMGRHG